MSAKEPDRSITSSSIFIPSWVKNQLDNSGFDPSALSPPTHDGEFFYVKIPISEKIEAPKFGRMEVPGQKGNSMTNHGTNRRSLVPMIANSVQVVKPKMTSPIKDMTETGANVEMTALPLQVISGSCKTPVRGFTTDDATEKPTGTYLSKRRNSKSLPASPMASPETSPRARRKNGTSVAFQNKYNLASVAASSLAESEESISKKSGSSWLLSALFSQSEKSGLAVKNNENSFAADAETKDRRELSGLMSKANVNVTVDVGPSDLNRMVYKQKRSQIRELNFISPLSM